MASKTSVPSSNWAQLKKSIVPDTKTNESASANKKRRGYTGLSGFKAALDSPAEAGPSRIVSVDVPAAPRTKEAVKLLAAPSESYAVHELREMVAGRAVLNEAKRAPGNYLAIDCEMVGLGPLGSESALARVSVVNYHGHVVLDTFVQPRERVTDYRTWVSGVREADIQGAPSFESVQRQVAALVAGRVLVGHALENDMKALLLSHPHPMVRDTQKCKMLRERAKTKRPGLKKLAELELGLQIQSGSHSSVTDARATMALYRLHKAEWERSIRHITEAYRAKTAADKGKGGGGKRKRADQDASDDEDDEDGEAAGGANQRPVKGLPGGGRKGVSSGLSIVVRRNGKRVEADEPRRRGASGGGGGGSGGSGKAGSGAQAGAASASSGNWWEQLPS